MTHESEIPPTLPDPGCATEPAPMPEQNLTPVDEDRILRRVELEGTGYRLVTWDTYQTDQLGKSRLGYAFYAPADVAARFGILDGSPLFTGQDFCCSPMHAVDETCRSILGFLTLKPGDTDREYFEEYEPNQLAWCKSEAEELQMWSLEPSSDDEYPLPGFVNLDADGTPEPSPPDWPSVDEIADWLRAVAAEVAGYGIEPEPGDDLPWCDVRLQVQADGWQVHSGDSQYDQDHRGWWGCSSVPADGSKFDARETAADLIAQAKDAWAEDQA